MACKNVPVGEGPLIISVHQLNLTVDIKYFRKILKPLE